MSINFPRLTFFLGLIIAITVIGILPVLEDSTLNNFLRTCIVLSGLGAAAYITCREFWDGLTK